MLIINCIRGGKAILVCPGPLTRLRAAMCAGNRGIKENGLPRDVVPSRDIQHRFLILARTRIGAVPSRNTLLLDSSQPSGTAVVTGAEIS